MGDIELPDEPSTPDGLFGAVDLGSRSFHLTVARVHGDNIEVVDRLRESVRLAAGVRDKGLDGATWTRCLDSLARIGERIRDIPEAQTRAVGTNAFRQLQKRRDVLGEAGAALGRRVEVISGAEEARLIYHGVSSTLPRGDERRLVIDIGGGSTGFADAHRQPVHGLRLLHPPLLPGRRHPQALVLGGRDRGPA